MTMDCPYCKSEMVAGGYTERASFSCLKCKVLITFIESLEEILEKYGKRR